MRELTDISKGVSGTGAVGSVVVGTEACTGIVLGKPVDTRKLQDHEAQTCICYLL